MSSISHSTQKKFGQILFFAAILAGVCPACTEGTRRGAKEVTQSGVENAPSPGSDLQSETAKNAAANAELFKEMYSIVLRQDPKDRAEFGNWVDTLNQGASLEGVYHGLVHSKNFQKLEETSRPASARAMTAFREEWSRLSAEGGSVNSTPPISARASIYTLKKELGERALQRVNALSPQQNELAQWYGKWAVQMCQRSIDFGVSLRNRADAGFHTQWAKTSSEDRLKWEVLNRLHRVLNEMEQRK